MDDAIYFLFNKFYSFDSSIDFDKEKEFISLPSKRKIKVNNDNLIKICKKVGLSLSQVASNIQGVEFLKKLPVNPAFTDLETDDKLNFICAYINDKFYDDAEEYMANLKKEKFIVVFNGFKFDMHLLEQWFSKDFNYETSGDFKIPLLKNSLVLDEYFWYTLWKRSPSHSLTFLAKDIGFEEERRPFDIDKELRCKQDIEVMQQAYPNFVNLFETLSSLVNCDIYLLQNSWGQKIRKMCLFKFWLDKGYLPTAFPKYSTIRKRPKAFLLWKKGFYNNCYHWDIQSAYTTVASNLDLTLYLKNDFTEVQRKLLSLRNEENKGMIKLLSVAMIGDQYHESNKLKNSKIWRDIVSTLSEKMKTWVDANIDKVVYSHTDSLILSDNTIPKIENFNIELKHHYEWCAIFTSTRYLGKTFDGHLIKRGFRRPYRFRIYDYLDSIIDKELANYNFKMLEDHGCKEGDVFTKIPRLCDMDKDMFSITIFKETEEALKEEFWETWSSLPNGFNTIYLSKDGWTLNEKEICYDRYVKLCFQYLRLYCLWDKREDKDKPFINKKIIIK